jgi:phage repressor protein C with HTH and peptisase S24 domain
MQPRDIATLLQETLHWSRGRRRVFVVSGASMEPTLSEGDRVWIDPALRASVGAIVVAQHPGRGSDAILIKRVRSLGAGTVALGSDDPTVGVDSRQFGSVDVSDVSGVVTIAWRHRARRFEVF